MLKEIFFIIKNSHVYLYVYQIKVKIIISKLFKFIKIYFIDIKNTIPLYTYILLLNKFLFQLREWNVIQVILLHI